MRRELGELCRRVDTKQGTTREGMERKVGREKRARHHHRQIKLVVLKQMKNY